MKIDYKKLWSFVKPIGKRATVVITTQKVSKYLDSLCKKYQVRPDYAQELVDRFSSLTDYLLSVKMNNNHIDSNYVEKTLRGPIAESLLRVVSSAKNSDNMIADLLSKIKGEDIDNIENFFIGIGVNGISEYADTLRNVLEQINGAMNDCNKRDLDEIPYVEEVDDCPQVKEKPIKKREETYVSVSNNMTALEEDEFINDLSSRLMNPKGRKVSPLEMVDLINKFVDASRDVAKFTEVQKTKRVAIRSAAEVKIKEIDTMRNIIQLYLEKTFDERRLIFEKQFQCVDKALETGDIKLLAISLNNITDLAKSSPFKALSDIGQVKNILEDKNAVFDI